MKRSNRNPTLLWAALLVLLALNVFTLMEVKSLQARMDEPTPSPAVTQSVTADDEDGGSPATPSGRGLVETTGSASESTESLVPAKKRRATKRKRVPCQDACDALGNCALESDVCSAASTTSDHLVRRGCLDLCRTDGDLANALELASDCRAMAQIARKEIKGFSTLCMGRDGRP